MPSAPHPLLTERWLSAALDISADLERHCWQPSRQIPIDANVWNSDSRRGREGGNGLTLLCAMLISKTHSGCFRKFLLGLWCFKHCVKLLNYLLRANHFHPPNYFVQKKKTFALVVCCNFSFTITISYWGDDPSKVHMDLWLNPPVYYMYAEK